MPTTHLPAATRAVNAMFLLNGALFGIWASRIPAVAEQHALTPATLGLLLLCIAGGAIVAFPLTGIRVDRIGAAPLTRRVALAYIAALSLIAIAPGTTGLAIALLLFGATHGAMDVAMNAWAAEVERVAARPMMNAFHAMFSLGAGLGAATGYPAVHLGLDLLPHFAASSLLIAAPTLWLASRPGTAAGISPTGARVPGRRPVFALPRGPLLLTGLVAFCSAIGEGAMADWSAVFLVTINGLDEARAALGYSTFSVAMVAMRLAGDRLIRRTGAIRTARLGGLLAVAGTLCAILGDHWLISLAGFALMGLGYATIVPLAFSRAANDPHTPPGQAIAGVATFAYGGILCGPPLIGFIAELASVRSAWWLLCALSLLVVLLARSLAPEDRAIPAIQPARRNVRL